MGVGMALALRIRKMNSRVFVLIGDGEANEGSIWESALLAAQHHLSNLRCIVDYNHSTDRALKVGDLVAKFKAFGWRGFSIDGHNHKEIYSALSLQHNSGPLAVVAETIKGFGCKLMENNPEWHHKVPRKDDLAAILEQLS
jgi:transketolase